MSDVCCPAESVRRGFADVRCKLLTLRLQIGDFGLKTCHSIEFSFFNVTSFLTFQLVNQSTAQPVIVLILNSRFLVRNYNIYGQLKLIISWWFYSAAFLVI